MRASDADRERIVSLLHKASTEGRIGSDELEQRVSAALKARTYGELDSLIADLPSPRSSSHRRRERTVPARAGGSAARVGGWALASVRANPWLLLVMIPAVAVTLALIITVMVVWAGVMVASMVCSGGPRRRRPPTELWTYHRDRRMYGDGPRRARSYWA